MGGGQIKGFTLVEILGVITLLSLISTILIIVVNKSLKETKETLYKSQLENIRSVASMWRTDNIERIPDGGYYTIILKKLIDNNYIDENIENPKTKEPFDKNTVIRISMKNIKIGEEQLLTVVSSGDGLYASELDEDRFIYRGDNPNNYIMLPDKDNNALYRIISYENDGTIKVIKNIKIGTKPWDYGKNHSENRNNDQNTYCMYEREEGYAGCNVWGNQSNTYLEDKLLEDLFYFKYYSKNSNVLKETNHGTVTQNSYINTFLNGEWLENRPLLSQYIDNHLFNVGLLEAGIELRQEKYDESLSKWRGKVGLINATDIPETSITDGCTNVWKFAWDNTDNSSFRDDDNFPCYSWIFNGELQATITATRVGFKEGIWAINKNHMGYYPANGAFNIRPSFFLKPTITLKGKGTKENPFEIVNQ